MKRQNKKSGRSWGRRLFAGMLGLALLTGCSGGNAGNAGATLSAVPQEADREVPGQEDNGAKQKEGTNLAEGKAASDGSNVLIVYFAVAENSDVDAVSSASMVMTDGEAKGRMRHLADLIQTRTGGTLFSIETDIDYPGDGKALIDYAAEEQDRNDRPEIISHIENWDSYDTIFVGYPTWWYDLPQVMYSFFDAYDFSGKTIIPFNSHNGSWFSGTIQTIEELEPGAEVITDGLTIHERDVADAEAEVASWLEKLGF